MSRFSKAVQIFSLIFILYAILAFVIIVHVIPFTSLLLGMALLTITGLLIAVFYSFYITRPIDKLEDRIKQISEGQLEEYKYPLNRQYTQVFTDLNNLVERLKTYKAKLSMQQEGFNKIIETIKEAIWIQNEKGIIRTFNTSFADLVQKSNIKDQYFWNVIRNKELYDIADRNFQQPASRTEEIEYEGRHFLCSTSYSDFNQETVFIMYDITEFRQLETIKKDFVLNVSHELRTPLTSIKGYLETFEDDLQDEYKSYVEVIKRNTDRLIFIVNDLLTLSRLEHDRSLEKETIDIELFLENIMKIFAHRLKEKKLQSKIEIISKQKTLQADRYKLEQVFINLIDNAVKYTDEGFVNITVQDLENDLLFEISDSGNGISQEHLPRLFERFYVVDKSRTRRIGGTGLGLSIVKHIVNLHDGTIDLESEIDKGTTFKIILPHGNK